MLRKKQVRSRSAVRRRVGRNRRSSVASRRVARRGVRIRLRQTTSAVTRRAWRGKGKRPPITVAQDSGNRRRPDAQYLVAVKHFEAGVVLFQKQSYDKAKEVFERVAAGAPPEVGNRARTYLRMCEQKLASAAPVRANRNYYDLGVAQLNARNLDAALENLKKAQNADPNQEHVRYALAAVYALQGNADAALEHLTAAIGRRPANRYLAARDEDFQSLAGDPRFQQLIRSGVA